MAKQVKNYYKELQEENKSLKTENKKLTHELLKVIVEPDTYEAETIRNFYKYMYGRDVAGLLYNSSTTDSTGADLHFESDTTI
jgi:regulator of replication initiation timing